MKDGRTHLAHKAEHAVDVETGAIVAVTLQGADQGDTTTIVETATAAAEQVEDAQADVEEPQALEEIVADKGYQSNQTMVDLDVVQIRSYIAEPDRARRDRSEAPDAQAPVYGNRRRIRGRRGRRLMRRRGETIERSFAHLYDTGVMRRTHLRGHTNILKRLLIHARGFNLGLVMRHLIGIGTPRGLQGRVAALVGTLVALIGIVGQRTVAFWRSPRVIADMRGSLASSTQAHHQAINNGHLRHGLLPPASRCAVAFSGPSRWWLSRRRHSAPNHSLFATGRQPQRMVLPWPPGVRYSAGSGSDRELICLDASRLRLPMRHDGDGTRLGRCDWL